jgi:hypothetical protein
MFKNHTISLTLKRKIMILVRDVFQLKFGAARPVKALMQESKKLMGDQVNKMRILFDLVGPAYTMVLEMTHTNLAEFEKEMGSTLNREEWAAWYQKFIPHVNSSYREIFTIQD